MWIHSGVPLTSLFSYRWASRTQREQEALDPDDLSRFQAHTQSLLPSNCCLGTGPKHDIIKRVTDKVSTDRWLLDLIMNICRFQPKQMCTTRVGNDHYQPRTSLLKEGESIKCKPRYPQLSSLWCSSAEGLLPQAVLYLYVCNPIRVIPLYFSGTVTYYYAPTRCFQSKSCQPNTQQKVYNPPCIYFSCWQLQSQDLEGIAFRNNSHTRW